MGADVTILEKNTDRMEELVARFGTSIKTIYSTQGAVEDECATADVVIGGVLIPGAAAPKLVTKAMLKDWKPGSVLVDVAIDQGGCFEDSRPTTHADPTFDVHGSVFYCVANMPGAVPHTSTYALTNVTLPYAVELADHGWQGALRRDPALRLGLNVHDGTIVYEAVADAFRMHHTDVEDVLA